MSTRKALLVGINAYPDMPLRGCINDVLQMQALLKRFYDFPEADIRLLLDGAATTAGIKAGLEWLAQDSDDDAVRVFHFSGHGSYVADTHGDEPDGRDECLVPYDYRTAGLLTDDTLKGLYGRFSPACNLTLVMDSCHSGSVNRAPELDIVYRFLPITVEEQRRIDAAAASFAEAQHEYVLDQIRRMRAWSMSEGELRSEVRRLMNTFEKKRFGDIRTRESNILLAGCRADQQSADARIAGDYHGAFTYMLAETIAAASGQLSYRELAEQVGTRLGQARFVQSPQLECRRGLVKRPLFQPLSLAEVAHGAVSP